MNRKLWLFLSLMIVISLMTAGTQAADSRYRIAVLPFDDGSIKERWWGGSWDVGAGVSDELVTALLATGKFRLIEREQIERVLKEQDFGASGRVDTSSAARIGKILGVQYLVMGRVTEFNFKSSGATGLSFGAGIGLDVKQTTAKVAIDARLVDSTSSEIVAAVTGRGEKKNTNVGVAFNWNAVKIGSSEFRGTNLGLALRSAVESVATQLGVEAYKNNPTAMTPQLLKGYVADVAGSKVYINIGSRDGVTEGMKFIIHHVIRLVKDPKTGEVIDEVTEPVAEVVIESVRERAATCVVTTRLSTAYPISINDIARQKQ
jgi:curli biogenesis system outer membrane secretion channel CsgG